MEVKRPWGYNKLMRCDMSTVAIVLTEQRFHRPLSRHAWQAPLFLPCKSEASYTIRPSESFFVVRGDDSTSKCRGWADEWLWGELWGSWLVLQGRGIEDGVVRFDARQKERADKFVSLPSEWAPATYPGDSGEACAYWLSKH